MEGESQQPDAGAPDTSSKDTKIVHKQAIPRIRRPADVPQPDTYVPGQALTRLRRPGDPGIPKTADPIPTATEANAVPADENDLYKEFCDSNPYVVVENVGAVTTETVQLPIPESTETFTLETRELPNLPVSLITAIYKEEDAVGAVIGADGKLVIAIADGVSSGLFPKAAARTAVRTALDYTQANGADRAVFGAAHNAIQQLGLEGYVSSLIDRMQAEATAARTADDAEKLRITRWRHKVKEYLDTNAYAATTLGVVSYDKANGNLQYALKSDTSLAIVKADGTYQIIKNGRTTTQIHYLPASSTDRTYHSAEAEIDGLAVLESGDIALVYSDGLETNLDDVLKTIGKTTSPDPTKRNVDAANVVKSFLTAQGIGDDVSVAIIAHT